MCIHTLLDPQFQTASSLLSFPGMLSIYRPRSTTTKVVAVVDANGNDDGQYNDVYAVVILIMTMMILVLIMTVM